MDIQQTDPFSSRASRLIRVAGARICGVAAAALSTVTLAATIDVGVGGCTLADAMTAANTDSATGSCAAGSGADTIYLPAGETQLLVAELPIIASGSTMTIEGQGGAIVRDNAAAYFRIFTNEGNLTLKDVSIRNGALESGNGGGIYNNNGAVLEMIGVDLAANSAGTIGSSFGGGLYSGGTLTIRNSTIRANTATFAGGGVSVGGSVPAQIVNSTFSGNVLTVGSIGGGIGVPAGTANLTVTDSTITKNVGGGIGTLNSATLRLVRTIVSGNTGAIREIYLGSGGPTVIVDGYNLFGSSAATTSSSIPGLTPGPTDLVATSNGTIPTALNDIIASVLDDNGGTTLTHALAAGSPAINAAGASCSAADQRGVVRPQGAACDIGAVELAQFTLEVGVLGGGTVTSDPIGINCGGDCDELYSAGTQVELTASPVAGWMLDGFSGDTACDNSNPCVVAMDQDRAIGATFVPVPIPNGEVCVVNDGDNVIDLRNETSGQTVSGLAGVRNVIFGSPYRDKLIGGNLDDCIEGGGGNDEIRGMGGDDVLLGGDGYDTVIGSEGVDYCDGESLRTCEERLTLKK